VLGEDLHRDLALEPAVVREAHGGHAPDAEALAQLVATCEDLAHGAVTPPLPEPPSVVVVSVGVVVGVVGVVVVVVGVVGVVVVVVGVVVVGVVVVVVGTVVVVVGGDPLQSIGTRAESLVAPSFRR
jgi:hypothetical protein